MAKPEQIRSALRIYRVMAVIAGVALFVLLAAMFVKYVAPKDATFSSVWSPIHGVIYMGYAAAIANLGFKARWPLQRIVLNMLTGFVPVLPFLAERRVTADTEALLSRVYFAGPGDADSTGSTRPGESESPAPGR
jgi:integral membrane protein